jgi:subtilisin family serine protease
LMQPHEDLTDALAVRRGEIPDNGVDDDNNGYVDDYRGYNFCAELGMGTPGNTWHPSDSHGSGVGGIVGATVNNALGIAGIANQCRMFPLRTMPDNIRGIVYGYESLLYCAVNDVDVVNCSWGSQSRSCIDADVIAYTIARGTAVVAAAGNHASPTPFFPASYRGVLSVGVVNSRDDVIAMSGHGPTVDVMAPGHDTWTTGNDGGYMGFCCTSGSSPIAAAIVGLVRSKHPELSPLEACAIVRESVDPAPWTYVPPTIDSLLLPRGRVNAYRAVISDPRLVISIEYDTVHLSAASGAQRWGIGDTLNITPWIRNVMGEWRIDRMRVHAVVGASQDVVEMMDTEVTVDAAMMPQQRSAMPPIRMRVLRATDDVAYVVLNLEGRRLDGEPVARRII